MKIRVGGVYLSGIPVNPDNVQIRVEITAEINESLFNGQITQVNRYGKDYIIPYIYKEHTWDSSGRFWGVNGRSADCDLVVEVSSLPELKVELLEML